MGVGRWFRTLRRPRRKDPSCAAVPRHYSARRTCQLNRHHRRPLIQSRGLLGTGNFHPTPRWLGLAGAARGSSPSRCAAPILPQRRSLRQHPRFLATRKYLLLPNTSGAMNAARRGARSARLARAAGISDWVSRDSSRPPLLLPDPWNCTRAGDSREGRLHRAASSTPTVLARRRGRGHRHRDAARLAHRQQPRH